MQTFNPWVLLGALATAIGIFIGGYLWGDSARNTWWLAKTETDKRKAVEAALLTERTFQEKANAALRQQAADQAAINTRLRTDLASLRDRPERTSNLPTVSGSGCQGATGAQLSRSDAGFLVGVAARADEISSGLIACYAVVDGVRYE
jgi:hypothetical protein